MIGKTDLIRKYSFYDREDWLDRKLKEEEKYWFYDREDWLDQKVLILW